MPRTEHVASRPPTDFSFLPAFAPLTLTQSVPLNSHQLLPLPLFLSQNPCSHSQKRIPTPINIIIITTSSFFFPFLFPHKNLNFISSMENKYPNPYPYPPPPPPHHHPRIHPTSGGGGGGGGGRSSKTNLASCVVATAFLIVVLIVLSLVFFLLFRPRDPTIQISAVQFPGFAARNGTVSFTFAQYASVRNPNRASFSHYDSTIRLLYAGNQVGFMYIPAGEIGGGRTQYMEASFAVTHFPLLQQQMNSNSEISMTSASSASSNMEVDSMMKLKGRVRVLRFFMHRVEATAACRVALAAANGAVLGVRC